MNLIKQLFLVLTMFILSSELICQTNYYVSLAGSDGNSGTSIAQSWRTIQKSMNDATPNSIVHIVAGTYNEKVEMNVSGSIGNQIIFRNNGTDEVFIDGSGINAPEALIGIFDQSYITIQGLNITNNIVNDAQGIIVEGDCQGVEIRDNNISNIHFSANPNDPANSSTNSQPLIIYGTNASNPIKDLVIDGNIVRDSRTGYSEGLAVNGNVTDFEITNNRVFNIANIGIDIIGHEGTSSANDQARNGLIKNNVVYDCKSAYATAAGIYVDGGKDLIIEANQIYNCQWGIEIGCENIDKTTSNVKVRDNMIYNNDDAGISIGGFDYPSGSGKVVTTIITNNTLFSNDKIGYYGSGSGDEIGELNVYYVEDCTIENNIFYARNPHNLMLTVANGSTNINLDYNNYFSDNVVDYDFMGNNYNSFSSFSTGANQDGNGLNLDPIFMDTSIFDLHIASSSPVKNNGNPSFSTAVGETDYDGQSRIYESVVDIGADELDMTLAIDYLQTFSGYYNNNEVKLSWQIVAPEKLEYFIVEKSFDGLRWIPLSKRIENTNTSPIHHIVDKNPFSPVSYYRLKVVEYGALFSYTNWLLFNTIDPRSYIYPNPGNGHFTIYSSFDIEHIQIVNNNGKIVYSKDYSDPNLNLNELPKGIYYVQIAQKGRTEIQCLIIK